MRLFTSLICGLSLLASLALLLDACASTSTAPHQDGALVSRQNGPWVSAPTPSASQARPIRLRIPSIGVNAPIEEVGITATGELAVPQVHPWDDAGWYSNGPRPGERGSAVIDGHLDRPGGLPAVFWRLRDLQPGAAVQVLDSQGRLRHFRVTSLAYYRPEAAPLQQIFANSGGSYLNLITCAGDWIPSQHQTTLRLVVYTTLVG